MKLETAIIITKGACYAAIGGLTPLATSLTQWANDGVNPPVINWVVICSGCLVGAATQVLSFLSQSFGTWKAENEATGIVKGQTPIP